MAIAQKLRRIDRLIYKPVTWVLYICFFFMVAACLLMGWLFWQNSWAGDICDNLLTEGLIQSEASCHLDGSQVESLLAMFPVEETDMDYVLKGMQGFEMTSHSRNIACDDGTIRDQISFELSDVILGTSVGFIF
jgi:hypothetical protein